MPLYSARIRYVFLALFLMLLFVTSTLVSFFIISSRKKTTSLPVETLAPKYLPSPTPKKDQIYSVLFIGYGGSGHSGGTLADVLMLLHINTDSKKASFISIPRDTWITISNGTGSQKFKVNMAHNLGGGTLTKEMVKTITGLAVDYYLAVDFSGFEKTIDTLGGINVNVPVSFTDSFYPIKGLEENLCNKSSEEITAIHATMSGYLLEQQFSCRYEKLQFTKGITQMDGKLALKFVRSRHSDQHGGDFARSQRQQTVLVAIKDKALSLGALDDAPAFFNQFRKTIQTDIDENIINMVIPILGHPNDYNISYINLTTDNVFNHATSFDGAYILVPKAGDENWSEIHQFIQQELLK